MALSTSTITAAIAALAVSGVTIKDMNEIPDEVSVRHCPIMFPMPGEIVGGYDDSPATFGGATGAYWPVTRTFTCIYLHAPINEGRYLYSHFEGMAKNADLIVEKFAELSITGVDILGVRIDNFSKPIHGPSGNDFHGFMVTFTAREKMNA